MQQPPLEVLQAELWGRRRALLWPRLFWHAVVVRGGWGAIILIRLTQHFERRRSLRLRQWAMHKLQRDYGCYVQPTAEIGPGLRLPHPNGVVIGSGVKIGARCTIYQQVTLGGARSGDQYTNAYPTLGDDVKLFAGAKVLGAISVGDGVTVAANAVVVKDVPANHIARGVPAKAYPVGDATIAA